MNKKGLSMIVSTLIIILLVLVAIGVIWAVVNRVITEGSDKIALDKYFIDLKVKNAYADGSDMIVTVERGAGEGELAGMTFVISDGSNSEIHSLTETLDQLETETYTLSLTELDITEVESVSVAPIYLTPSGEEIVGDVTDINEPSESDLSGGSGSQGCTPDCDGKECGDDGCGSVCGTCGDGYVCNGTSICVLEEECEDTCLSLNYECGTFEVCGVSTDCGNCTGTASCNATGVCESEAILTAGVVSSIWPGSAPTYFDSDNLPKNTSEMSDYLLKYINFSSSPLLCYQITIAEYAPGIGGYNMSHLGFDYVVPHMIANDTFDVWETETFCGS